MKYFFLWIGLLVISSEAFAISSVDKDKRLRELTHLQYKVTQESATEKPFENPYWNNNKEGIYVDIVSGEPLFSSKDKFESGTGWPSFTKPIHAEYLVFKKQRKFLLFVTTEVRSKGADSHLGHVFDDGPPPTGLRYCINSAALTFIPKKDMAKQGYSEYLYLFDSKSNAYTKSPTDQQAD